MEVEFKHFETEKDDFLPYDFFPTFSKGIKQSFKSSAVR